MDRRNTDMKNKIKKILLLGMTAMFTAGAAGTAVISCPVWADEAEQKLLRLQKSQKQKMQLWKKKLLIRQMIKQKIQI